MVFASRAADPKENRRLATFATWDLKVPTLLFGQQAWPALGAQAHT